MQSSFFQSSSLSPSLPISAPPSLSTHNLQSVSNESWDFKSDQSIMIDRWQSQLEKKHRLSCHRCGNIRKNVTPCALCPHIFCIRCTEKLVSEHGEAAFQEGCPVCKQLCCCTIKSLYCNRKFHCYKKCPLSRANAIKSGNLADGQVFPPSQPNMESIFAQPINNFFSTANKLESAPVAQQAQKFAGVENPTSDKPQADGLCRIPSWRSSDSNTSQKENHPQKERKSKKRAYKNMTSTTKLHALAREAARRMPTASTINYAVPLHPYYALGYSPSDVSPLREHAYLCSNLWGQPMSMRTLINSMPNENPFEVNCHPHNSNESPENGAIPMVWNTSSYSSDSETEDYPGGITFSDINHAAGTTNYPSPQRVTSTASSSFSVQQPVAVTSMEIQGSDYWMMPMMSVVNPNKESVERPSTSNKADSITICTSVFESFQNETPLESAAKEHRPSLLDDREIEVARALFGEQISDFEDEHLLVEMSGGASPN